MGQQEVYDFLKKNQGKWFSVKDISKLLEASPGSVTNNCKKLRESNQIAFKKQKMQFTSCKKEVLVYKFKD